MHNMTLSSTQLDQEMGRRVDALLRLARVSRSELAAYLGKQQNSISHKLSVTRGRSFDKWEVLAIAEWLGVDVGVLYGTAPIPPRLERPNQVVQNLKVFNKKASLPAQMLVA